MTRHSDKHYKRLRRELMTMRNGIIRSFRDVNQRRFSEDSARRMRETVDKDKALIKHIDAVIAAVNDFLEDKDFKLPPVPRVTIRKIKPPKEIDPAQADFTIQV